jgi:hypothetical protein
MGSSCHALIDGKGYQWGHVLAMKQAIRAEPEVDPRQAKRIPRAKQAIGRSR